MKTRLEKGGGERGRRLVVTSVIKYPDTRFRFRSRCNGGFVFDIVYLQKKTSKAWKKHRERRRKTEI